MGGLLGARICLGQSPLPDDDDLGEQLSKGRGQLHRRPSVRRLSLFKLVGFEEGRLLQVLLEGRGEPNYHGILEPDNSVCKLFRLRKIGKNW